MTSYFENRFRDAEKDHAQIRSLVDLRGRRVLDVGCETGGKCFYWSQCGARQVIGIDISLDVPRSPEMNETPRAGEQGRGVDPEFCVADGADMPFASGAFDIVTLHDVLEHLAQPARVLCEARRVLRPGGWISISSPHYFGLSGNHLWNYLDGGFWRYLHPHLVLPKAMLFKLVAHIGKRKRYPIEQVNWEWRQFEALNQLRVRQIPELLQGFKIHKLCLRRPNASLVKSLARVPALAEYLSYGVVVVAEREAGTGSPRLARCQPEAVARPMLVTVLICTYNRPDMLEQCLSALLNWTAEKPDQVVVVNGGDERADRVVERYASVEGVEVKLVKTVNKNLAASRNVGLPHCTGDIIAMTDDDAEVFPDWVTRMKQLHAQHPEAGAVGGPVIGVDTSSWVGKAADLITFPRWETRTYVRTLPGVNISYKREIVEAVGMQDESLFRGEDVDYNWRLQKLGYKVLFDPAVRVRHNHRATLKKLMNQQYMYGRAYWRVRGKWPEMYCAYPHRLSSPRDLAKGLNFAIAPVYEPILLSKRSSVRDRLLTYPFAALSLYAWRAGVLSEALSGRER